MPNSDDKAQSSGLIRFGPYEVDPHTGQVWKYGIKLKLSGQPLEILLFLVERAGELVTRDEIQQRLWPRDVFVDFERSLNSAIKKLRAALNDNPETPRYIETLPRKGYRFIGQILESPEQETENASEDAGPPIQTSERLSSPASPDPLVREAQGAGRSHTQRWWWAAVVLLALMGGLFFGGRHRTPTLTKAPVSKGPNVRSSIAILGFKNLSSQHEGDWLGSAVVQMLATELQAGGKLRIVPDEDVARAKKDLDIKEKDGYPRDALRELQKHLSTDYIVAGSYVALGNKESGQVRLDIRLQETISGETLASIAVSGMQSEIFELVGRAGRDMRSKVEATMGPGGDVDWRAVLPSNAEAARLYIEGLNRMRVANNVAATELLQQSLAIAPEFALAHAALASAWQALGYDARAQASAQKALSLAASLPENARLKIEGQYYESQHDWAGAVPAYSHLVQDYPDDLDSALKLAENQVHAGDLSDAASTISSLRSQQAASRQDPRIDLVEAQVAAHRSDFKAQLELARSAAKKADSSGAPLLLARAKLIEGWGLDDQAQLDGALQAYRAAQPIFETAGETDNAATVLDDIGIVLEKQGDLKGAQSSMEEAEKRFRQIGDQNGLGAALTNLGELYHAEGDLTSASDLYREALQIFRKTARKENEYAALNNLGGVLVELGDFREAKNDFEKLLEFKQSSGDKSGLGYAKMNLAGVLWIQGEIDQSMKLLDEALRVFQEAGDRTAISSLQTAYSKVLLVKHDLPRARRALSEALKIDQEIGAKGDIAVDQIGLAQVSLLEGHAQQVDEATVQSSIDELRAENRGADEMESLTVQIQAFLARGKLEAAEKSLAQAQAVHHTSWLSNYHLTLAAARIDAAEGKIAISRRKIAAARSQAEKMGCRACDMESALFPSKVDTQGSTPFHPLSSENLSGSTR